MECHSRTADPIARHAPPTTYCCRLPDGSKRLSVVHRLEHFVLCARFVWIPVRTGIPILEWCSRTWRSPVRIGLLQIHRLSRYMLSITAGQSTSGSTLSD